MNATQKKNKLSRQATQADDHSPFAKFLLSTRGYEFVQRADGKVIEKWIMFDDHYRSGRFKKIMANRDAYITMRRKKIIDNY